MPPMNAARSNGSEPTASPAPGRSRRRATPPDLAAPGAPAASVEPAAEPLAPPDDREAGATPVIEEGGSWIQADAVEVRQGAVGRVDATEVDVTQGAVGAARADRIAVQMGAIGAAMAREVDIAQGGAGSILAGQARIDQSFVRTLVAQHVEIHRPSAVLFLIAQRVTGDIRPVLDWRGALAFGAAFGVVAGLFGRARRGGSRRG